MPRPACWCASARRSASTGTASASVGVVHEALECHGGNGFIEEGPMARLYREAPLNGIWEGSGNIIALDVLRAASRSPQSVPAFLDEVRRAKGGDRRLDRLVAQLEGELARAGGARGAGAPHRRADGGLPAGEPVIRHSPPAVADAFCATRLDGDGGVAYGSLPAGLDQRAIVERARMLRCRTLRARSLWSPAGRPGSDAPPLSLSAVAARRSSLAGRRRAEGEKAVAALAEIGATGRFIATDVTRPRGDRRACIGRSSRTMAVSTSPSTMRATRSRARPSPSRTARSTTACSIPTCGRSISACSIRSATWRSGAAAPSWSTPR